MTPADQLRALITASGLSVTEYAHQRMAGRSAQAVYRWIKGAEIPGTVRVWMDRESEKARNAQTDE